MQDYIEYEFLKRDGTKRYEMVNREYAAKEMMAFMKMHDAVEAYPAEKAETL